MSSFLGDEMTQMKDRLMTRFLNEAQFQLNDKDLEIVSIAKELIFQVRKYKVCHFACCALFQSGECKNGTQLYSRRMHEFSMCAESRPIERAHWSKLIRKPDPILTLATYHAGHDHNGKMGEPYLASPCPRCSWLLNQVSPDCLVVIDLDGRGRLAKIPLDAVPNFMHPHTHLSESV